MIKVFDNKVPYHVQSDVYNFIINSTFELKGWQDRNDIEKFDLHSKWSIDDIRNSKLYPYIDNIQSYRY